jgi:hypothetical protein
LLRHPPKGGEIVRARRPGSRHDGRHARADERDARRLGRGSRDGRSQPIVVAATGAVRAPLDEPDNGKPDDTEIPAELFGSPRNDASRTAYERAEAEKALHPQEAPKKP